MKEDLVKKGKMTEVSIPWLDGTRTIEIDEALIRFIATPNNPAAVSDPDAEILDALRNPVKSPGLKTLIGDPEGKKVAVVIDDNTRVTPVERVLTVLVKELEVLGVSPEQVVVILALGSHRYMTPDEIRKRVGDWCYERVSVINHEYKDPAELVDLGKTSQGTPVIINRVFYESDVRLCIGNIIPQFIAGWSGGAKIIQPGISGADTTARVHLNGSLTWPKRLGNAENDIRHDMEEIAERAGLQFIINTILNLDEDIYRVVAGDVVSAHRKGVEYAKEIYQLIIPEQADIVIAGSYPANKDMWQADKGLAAAVLTVKPGKTVIWAAPCVEGVSPEHPILLELKDTPPRKVFDMCENGEIDDVVGATAHIMIGVMREMANVILVSDGVSRKECESMGISWAPNLETALKDARAREGEAAGIGVITHGADLAPLVENSSVN